MNMNQHAIIEVIFYELIWGNCFSKRFGKLDFFIGKMQKNLEKLSREQLQVKLILKEGFVTLRTTDQSIKIRAGI